MVSFTLNSRQVQVDDFADLTLLDVLRDRLGVTSPKNGCAPAGQCGCCTMLVDGLPQFACRTDPATIAGKHITTLEGLSEQDRRLLAECFVRAGAVQCGYCTPGIAMRAHALLERNPNPSRSEIAGELVGHLCRCTGYKKVIDAVELLARVRRGAPLPPNGDTSGVGASLAKYEAREAAIGQRKFIADITMPGMVHAVMRFSDHPRALVKRIDASAAQALPGVLRVATWRDVPGERYVGLIEQDWPIFIAEGEETRCIGDILAAVVAEDSRTARRAVDLIRIEYEVRKPIVDPEDALRPGTPRIHPDGNLLSRAALVRGDVDAALAASAYVVEDQWETQRVEHMFLEPEACLAMRVRYRGACASATAPDNGRIRWKALQNGLPFSAPADLADTQRGLYVLSQGQGVFDDRRQICKILGWPLDRVDIELVSSGGAFGGKEDMSIQGQTALLAHLVNRPVRVVLTRRESLRLHPKRHPIRLRYKVGCDADGRLTALRARIIGDTGAYASVGAKVLERTAGHAAGPYRIPNVDIEALTVYTNNPPSGAMRGFGVCQAAFAVEGCLDLLAEKVGIDAWEIRNRNIIEPGDVFCTGQRMTKPFGLRKTLEAVKDAYREARYAGIACGVKNVGIGNGLPESGKASLTVEPNGRITIRSGFTEMGQGLFTVLIQTAVQETGLPADIFDVTTDTRDDLDCGQTTASRGTVLGCHGVITAARKLKADLDAGKRLSDLAGRTYDGRWDCFPTDAFGADVPDPVTHLTYGFATQVVILDDRGRIKKVIAAHDAGRVVNPLLAEGQIEGAIHMGLGYALTEELVVEGGHIQSNDIKSCGILRAHQMPEVEVIFVEEGDPDCPYGAKGIGEIGLVPTAAAVAGALYAYDKVPRRRLPMRDSPAAKALVRMKPPRPGK
jgi:xanthine dehydrogenase molybdenum-binding subunit